MAEYIIPAAAAIIVAIIEAMAAKERKQAKEENKKTAERAEIRARESWLQMKMMSATLKLSVVTANALTGGHNNGNVEEAKQAANEAMTAYTDFIQSVASKEVTK